MQLKVGSKRSYEGYQIDWNWQAVRWRRMWENMGRLSELFVVEMLSKFLTWVHLKKQGIKSHIWAYFLPFKSHIVFHFCVPIILNAIFCNSFLIVPLYHSIYHYLLVNIVKFLAFICLPVYVSGFYNFCI